MIREHIPKGIPRRIQKGILFGSLMEYRKNKNGDIPEHSLKEIQQEFMEETHEKSLKKSRPNSWQEASNLREILERISKGDLFDIREIPDRNSG